MGYRPALALAVVLTALKMSAGEPPEVAGVVRDTSGVPLTGVSVTFVNLETGRRHTALSDDEGPREDSVEVTVGVAFELRGQATLDVDTVAVPQGEV